MNSSQSFGGRIGMAVRSFLVSPIAVLAVTCVTGVHAQDAAKSDANSARPPATEFKPAAPNRESRVKRNENYVGVFAEKFAESEAAQPSSLLARGQGILVNGVLPASPAARAGLRRGDILAEYGDQKLFNVQQLRQLTIGDRSGRIVKLKVLREGRLQTLEVKLAQRTVQARGDARAAPVYRLRGNRKILGGKEIVIRSPVKRTDNGADSSIADKVDGLSLVITTEDGKQFQLQVTYHDDKGTPTSKLLKGTPADIRQQSSKLSKRVRKRVDESIGRVDKKAGKVRPSFRFQIQPVIDGSQRRLQLRLQQPGDGEQAVRILELDLGEGAFEVDVAKLLKSGPLEQELKQLPPEIRKRVESTLRKARIPEPRVRVRQSQ